jgi:serine/threonine protein kinase
MSIAMIPLDQFEVIAKAKLGKGCSGETFQATMNNNNFAVKIVTKLTSDSEVFEKELGLYSSTSHENIVTFVGCGLESSKYSEICTYYVIKEEAKCSLQDIFDKERDYFKEASEARKLIFDITSARYYLQLKNIGHGQLNPKNILLSKDGSWKLADLGCGIKNAVSVESPKKTVGDSLFMCPEIERNFVEVDEKINWHKADAFSFGLLLLKICGIDNIAGLNDHSEESQEKITNIIDNNVKTKYQDEDICQILKKCLRVKAEERWDFDELREYFFIREIKARFRNYFSECDLKIQLSTFGYSISIQSLTSWNDEFVTGISEVLAKLPDALSLTINCEWQKLSHHHYLVDKILHSKPVAISDKGLGMLSKAISKMKSIETLHLQLNTNVVTDEGIIDLYKTLESLKNLTKLHLASSRINYR